MGEKNKEKVGSITKTVMVVAGFVIGWVGIELAFRPFLKSGRSAMDRSLNPDYDPDDSDDLVKRPLDASKEEEQNEGKAENEEEDLKAAS
ncbi:hypothetical protein O6H91_02G117100 [Diphasiastrum complanatum]|uniref:Uncharacterized protein n=1 Tax=Diphasiastrum complanatum TaxID=34168 RepID=A0ACC2EJP4_DIPCM|nr:hypothetical protein O6H91_Y010600 [Diphasiastrum complanatum]KAJ7566758.1 hypothetical protein O6H91_02G117100 [Diphasiastrum complanatum]